MSVKSRIVRLEGALQVQARLDADRDARFRELSQQKARELEAAIREEQVAKERDNR